MLKFSTALASATLVLVSATSATGAPAQHDFFEETYDGSEYIAADENTCGPWAMTIHEVRSGGYRIVAAPGGQVTDEFHINGAVDGHVQLVPDDPNLPTYTGSYREKVNGVIVGFDEEEGDVARVAQYRLRIPVTGTDGSKLVLSLAGKMTMNANGRVTVSRDSYTCR